MYWEGKYVLKCCKSISKVKACKWLHNYVASQWTHGVFLYGNQFVSNEKANIWFNNFAEYNY